MKTFEYLLCIVLIFNISMMHAQTPQKINYQAVARDNAGKPLNNKAISLRLSILTGSTSGSTVYAETHKVTTNDYGQFSVAIGSGTVVSGIFKNIIWDVSDKYVKIEFDPNGGTTYTNMGTVQLVSVPYALNADKANALSGSAKVLLPQIDAGGALNGQILGWNGTAWVPMSAAVGSSDNWGTQTAQTNNTLSGNGTTTNPLAIASQGASNGQILKFNGTTWTPSNVTSGADNWGTQVAQTNGTISGNGTASSPLSIAQQSAISNQILRWDGTKWTPSFESPGSDNWGTQSAVSSGGITGNGTASSPLTLASQSANVGQVLKWSGSGWIPANDSSGDNWGSQNAVTTGILSGNGTSSNPLTLAQNGATSGQFLQWNGTAWVPVTASAGGDNWGSQTVQINATLAGNGTSANPLKIAQQGASSGQILQWNGTAWVPATATTGGDNWGSQVTQTNASISGNGTSSSPLSIAQQGATSGQLMQWTGSAWAPVTLTMSGDNWGSQTAITTSTLTGAGTASNPLGLASQSATNGQVLKWNGSAWVPRNDSAGGTYTGANGIAITGSTIQLGGNLTGSTTITTTASNTLALAGIQSAGAGDSILSQNPTTNVITRISPDRIGGGGQWTKDAANNLWYKNGNIMIGTDTPNTAKLHVYSNSSALDTALYIKSSTTLGSGNFGMVSEAFSSAANASVGGRFTGNGAGAIGVGRQTISNASTINGVLGAARSTFGNSRLMGVYGESDTSSGNMSIGVSGLAYHTGIFGNANFSSNQNIYDPAIPFLSKYGMLGYNSGTAGSNQITSIGAAGIASNSNTAQNFGVVGASNTPIGTALSVGVYGRSLGGDTIQIGVLGEIGTPIRTGARIVLAGYFNSNVYTAGVSILDGGFVSNANSTITGNLAIAGTLSKTSGTFKIDHPLDPENKFLYHSFVESPDMMNIYNGNITTNHEGIAVVELPNYFTALNKDFRYQLTSIGSFSPIMIKEKIANNKFTIQSKDPNVEVSWQVTGIRKDPYAEMYPIKTEVLKSEKERGKYIHPEVYNQPNEKGIYFSNAEYAKTLRNLNLHNKINPVQDNTSTILTPNTEVIKLK